LSAQSGKGYVLDGFPRTLPQAQELDKALKQAGKTISVVLNLDVDDEKLETRVTGRRSCPKCGAAYHIQFNPPQKAGVCDNGCGELTQRPDDTSEVVRNRIKNYHDLTAPLINYYKRQSNLVDINGNASIENVTQTLLQKMDEVARKAG